ncbi:hypothetical protein HGRIS_003834 [Hohenbuehelia grisea]|uniref:Protein-S-isoprenylcysteine O-methyltransferase n=1 Tax=Hohenbuehelia grisea TaxID=104357 RepID=A0ABR3JGR0_9AGAR
MMDYTLVKPLSLVIAGICFRISVKSPTPPPSSKDQVYTGNAFEKMTSTMAFVNRSLALLICLASAAVHLAIAYPDVVPEAVLTMLCPLRRPNSDTLYTITPSFLIGFLLVILGTVARIWCYKTLGRHFTFEVSLLHDHSLVTSGPYAYVRHPSYGACIPLFAGMGLMLFGRDEWVRQSGILSSPLGYVIIFWVVLLGWVSYYLWNRISIEDENLRKRFGSVWESYARDVPYTLIPGLY